MEKTVVELFAGVGGFRVGLNNITKLDKHGRAIEKGDFNFVWANQWEPSTKSQDAFLCYVTRFGSAHVSNSDIATVDKKEIPEHNLLVGGFPCQDYSVARTKSNEKGIEGKKGVLWWQIREILEVKKTPFVLLENVDRLIKSPSSQRGRDFGIMLRCFDEMGYWVEWRVINAANYGMPQRRRRVYIFAYKKDTEFAKSLFGTSQEDILLTKGCIARTFAVEKTLKRGKSIDIRNVYDNLISISDNFTFPFLNSGCLKDGIIYTAETTPVYKGPKNLSSIIETDVSETYFLTDEKIGKFNYLRDKKKILRTSKSGYQYYYSEGSMSKYDDLSLPSRTMLTSESSTNRSTHIILDPEKNRLRYLTPKECERLNMFPDDWTCTSMSKSRRYFMMGNALVCGVINLFGKTISKIMDKED